MMKLFFKDAHLMCRSRGGMSVGLNTPFLLGKTEAY